MRSFLAVFASLVLYASAIGQTDCLFSTDIQVTTAYWGAEISWNIVDLDGNVLIEGGEYGDNSEYQSNACLDSTCYVLNMYDSFGDGWNGATISVNLSELGLMIGEFTLESGNSDRKSVV